MHVIRFHIFSPRGAPLMCFLDLQVEYVAEDARSHSRSARPGWRTAGACSPSPPPHGCRCALPPTLAGHASESRTPFAGWMRISPAPVGDGVRAEMAILLPRLDDFRSILDTSIPAPRSCGSDRTRRLPGDCARRFPRKHRITFVHDASSTPRLGTLRRQKRMPTWPRLSTATPRSCRQSGS